jgi:hypothetical protein
MSSTNIPIYPGSSSFFPGMTPFGFYDNQYDFQVDADKVTRFCALRLGYPIENVELQDLNFYAAFEEAVTVYGNELYAYQTRDNYLSLEGESQNINANTSLYTPTMASIVRISQQYGEEAGTGGNVTWYQGQLELQRGVQKYDLAEWAVSQSISGGIEIKNVFYQPPPAVNQLYSTALMAGQGGLGGVPPSGLAGFGVGYSSYLMMPTSFTMQNIQAIEMQNTVMLSNYSFNIINNILTVFPIPGSNRLGFDDDIDGGLGYGHYLIFDFIKLEDRLNSAITSGSGKITNSSNVPYNNPNYNDVNSIGRSWIFEYTLSITKEMLGYVRNKYSQIPIPGAAVTLNGDTLISSAQLSKEALILKLRTFFDETSRKSLLERRAAESLSRVQEISQVPMSIFIG